MTQERRGRGHMRRSPGACVVELAGDIDLAAVPEVGPLLEGAAREAREAGRVVVDLREVTFFDCTLLSLLCRTRQRVLAGQARFDLVCEEPGALRLLRLTELLEVFAPVASPAELAGC